MQLIKPVLSSCIAIALTSNYLGTRAQTPNTFDLLSRYGNGQYTEVANSLKSIRSFGDFREELTGQAARDWLRRYPPEKYPGSRLIVAAFALEAAAAHLEGGWSEGKLLVEWACRLLREERVPQPGERLWHLAAIALIQGVGDTRYLVRDLNIAFRPPLASERALIRTGTYDHIHHVRTRFPDEPRWSLAEVFVLETDAWPAPRRIDSNNLRAIEQGARRALAAQDARERPAPDDALALATGRSFQVAELARERLQLLENDIHLASEARLRIGYIHLRLGRPDAGLIALGKIQSDDDPYVVYLARLFAAWSLADLGRHEESAAAYREALTVVPHASSAVIPLSAYLFSIGQGDEAASLLRSRQSDPQGDPWRLFSYGDFRKWPTYLHDLRASLR